MVGIYTSLSIICLLCCFMSDFVEKKHHAKSSQLKHELRTVMINYV